MAKSNETLLAIIDVLYEQGGATVTEIADVVGVSKSTVHRHLGILQKHDYVMKEASKYALGFRFLELGGHARHRDPTHKQVKSIVRNIAEETGEFVVFLVEEHGLGIYIYSEWVPRVLATTFESVAGSISISLLREKQFSPIFQTIELWRLSTNTDSQNEHRRRLLIAMNSKKTLR